jgi:cytochrome c oxidase subunit I
VHLHDTYFVVAHFHYVMMGGTLFAFLGGMHYWWPKMFGQDVQREPGAASARSSSSSGSTARSPETIELFQFYHIMSTVGSYIMAIGFFLTAGYLLHSIFKGKKAPANPWGGRSLEWQCASPPPHDNFAEPPTVGDCYDFSVLEWDEAEQGYKWRDDVPRPGEDAPRH